MKLNKEWQIFESGLEIGASKAAEILMKKEGWLDTDIPADVRMPLLEKGLIKEPLKADYSFESEWIERRAWWFKKEFDGNEVNFGDDIIELVMEGLDSRADIFLNGVFLGTHRSVHYPFVKEVKEYLVSGKNTILVRMTSGLEEITEENMAELNWAVCVEQDNGGKYRSDKRRAFVRRPQYTVGWDWGPKVVTIGITGDVRLEGHRNIALREVHAETVCIDKCARSEKNTAKVKVTLNVENLDFFGTKNGDYKITISHGGETVASKEVSEQLLTSGYNYLEETFTIEDAKLWWPNGYGEQPLYEVNVEVICEGAKEEAKPIIMGIRTLRFDTSVISGNDRKFELVVNDVPIYCKGGNWIPNDFIYARVTDEKYRVLLEEAVELNFNMLRVWGGGLYERDYFYNQCTEKGILIWQDLMFACATLPDHREEFVELIRKELDYQTKRLRNFTSLGLICGSNEVHWLFNPQDNPQRELTFTYEHQYGMSLMNVLAKEVIRANAPELLFWNSSPYGGPLPNSYEQGDIHLWQNAFMSLNMEDRNEPKDYDKCGAKFISEYGYVGPCCRETIEEYMDGQPLDRASKTWWWHSNVFERGTVHAAIEKNYVDEADKLSLDDYITYGGMVHGLMYAYSQEAFKFKENCFGSLLWMYNDAWGEVGWTLIDYYLRRKIPFYLVKRALAHRKAAMRVVDGKVLVQAVNDRADEWKLTGKIGYVSFDGKVSELSDVSFEVAPHSRGYVLELPLPDKDLTAGTIMFYIDDEDVPNASLRVDDMRKLAVKGAVELVSEEIVGEDRVFTVRSDVFAHGVHVTTNRHCDDNYFDLLPGETRTFTVFGGASDELKVEFVQ